MIKLSNSRWWSTKQGRWVVRLTTAFLVYSLIGFFILPPIIKWRLVKDLPKSTKRAAEVREVRVNPWTIALTIRGLELKEPNGDLFASWEDFYANFQLSSLFRLAWTFKEIHLIDPNGAVVLKKDGKLNFANMFEPDPNAPPKPKNNSEISRVMVFLLNITNGFVSIDDLTRRAPFHTEYRPINI